MNQFLKLTGGNKLEGRVKISGSKNSVLPCAAAAILTDEPVSLNNVPLVADLFSMLETLESIGVSSQLNRKAHSLILQAGELAGDIPSTLSSTIRGSVFLLGPLLARKGAVRFGGVGGCNIGKRPIDILLDSMTLLGSKVIAKENVTEILAENLKGAIIEFKFPSVGATINSIMASVLIEGETVLRNIALEPEVIDLTEMLKEMGAIIKIDESNRIASITGVQALQGTLHRIIPDRIEAGTYAAAAACTGGNVLIENVVPHHIKTVLDVLSEFGVSNQIEGKSSIRIQSEKENLVSVEIETSVYPGFPTDLQPQFTALSTMAAGISKITETVFDNRFHHIPELVSMGANIRLEGNKIVIQGPNVLKGRSLIAKELRGGVALVIASLCAEGDSIISGYKHILRGYENLDHKLSLLGAEIELDEDS